MRRKRYTLRSLIWSSIQVALGAVLLFQVAYWRLGDSTTNAASPAGTPTVAIAQVEATRGATATPDPLIFSQATPFFVTPAATSTLPPSAPIPVALPPSTPTPTPFIAPDYLRRDVTVYVVETPPPSTECGQQGFVFKSKFPSKVGRPWREYHAYLPPCYGRDGRVYPVLYLLHGSGHTDSQWVRLGLAQHIDQGIAEGAYPPFIVIMPDSGEFGDTTSGGPRSVEGVFMGSLLPYVEQNFCSWNAQEGRAIGGISRGGYWALMLAFRHAELFMAVSGHSSHLRLETDPAEYNPLATYATANLSSMRIWLDWGDYDFLRAGQQQLHELLMTAGIPHSVKINSGGHANYYWYENMRDYLNWHAQNWSLSRETYPPCER